MVGGLLGSALLVTGCATKKFVQEEVAKSQQKVGADVGRVETALGEEKARSEQLQRGLAETRTATAEADRKATEATALAGQASTKATEANTKATEAASRADAASATAKEALAKATDTDQRLTKLWTNRNKRTLTDTQLVHFGFDKWELDDGAQTKLLALAKQLQDQPELTVELEGFTDNIGASAYNVGLSQRRAEAVRRFLVEKGIDLPGSTTSAWATSAPWRTTRPARGGTRTDGSRSGSTHRRSDRGPTGSVRCPASWDAARFSARRRGGGVSPSAGTPRVRRGFLPAVPASGILVGVETGCHARQGGSPPRQSGTRESGGTGRRAGLRIQWAQIPWGFNSPLSHHTSRRTTARSI